MYWSISPPGLEFYPLELAAEPAVRLVHAGEASGEQSFSSTPIARCAVPVMAYPRLLPIATAANEMGWTEMAPAEKGGVTATRERVRNTHTRHNESKEIRRDQTAPPPPAPGRKRPR